MLNLAGGNTTHLRDSIYYIEDGTVVILVESTLFKVHQSMLIKDRSTFQSMFSLDEHSVPKQDEAASTVGPTTREGTDDSNPIVLQGDSADEFRALLWSLYSLPSDILLAMTAEASDLKFIHLAQISHKYQFRSIEAWALQVLTSYYALGSVTPHIETLVQLTELAVLCDSSDLLNAAILKWKRMVGEGKALSTIIIVAERLNLRGVLGLAYHSMMLKGRSEWDADPLLSRSQRIRLLSGHYTLSQICSELPSTPPRLKHANSCLHRSQCKIGWAELWKTIHTTKEGGISSQIMKLQSADLLGRMMLAESIIKAFGEGIPTEGLLDDIHEKCFKAALKTTQEKVKEIQENLVDWFSDVM
ncbi:hypothetical protein BDZ94DRAFT_1191536 [Collybia nuda]|uniref:BTB domain-containing protein n=1 Tax=Collybia nuda TaxID=64659 RepID=A0A9P5Y8J1_9AGAR|nr:hypothetical protein BDZ94DRAFT_1191536 [Collybia nuda]